MAFRCVIHGSFGKHFAEIQRAHRIFTEAGIEVLAPKAAEIVDEADGFALLEGEQGQDPRLIELLYLQNLRGLGEDGFSYFVNPGGYIGKSASYELGIAQTTNVRCFFAESLEDHPAYFHANTVITPEQLAYYIVRHKELPLARARRNEKRIQKLWSELMIPGSVVAVGAVLEYRPRSRKQAEILLVKTHKWGDRYSIVGGKVRRNERLASALLREVREETGLGGEIGKHLATFDQIKRSGYYREGTQHIFVDNVVHVNTKSVQLNEEAEDYLWAPADIALRDLDIEPNARHTIELYHRQTISAGRA